MVSEGQREVQSLSIVIPALNEWENLKHLIPRIHAALAPLESISYEVVLVLDTDAGESDIHAAQQLAARAIKRRGSNSFGSAVRSGIAAVPPTQNITVFMDADGSHDPASLPRLLDEIQHADVVVASRYIEGGSTDNSLPLKVMSRTLNVAYRLILGIKCHDVSTSYKAYKTD